MSNGEAKKEVTHSLNSLICEIAGVSEVYDENYDSVRRQVYRIFKAIRKTMGIYDQGMPEVTEEHKATFVRFMKAFYEDEGYKKTLNKYAADKDVSLEENDRLIDFVVANLVQDLPDDKKQEFLDAIEFQKDDESYEMAENIKKKVHDDLVAIIKLGYPPARREFLEQYNRILEEAFALLRQEMEILVRVRDFYIELQDEARLNGEEEEFLANPEFILEFARRVVIDSMGFKSGQE